MPAILRRLSQVGLLAAALSATAGDGYLPKVGPPAVRFELPAPPPAEPTVILPPLPFIEARPANAPEATVPTPLVPTEPPTNSLPDAPTTAAEPFVQPMVPVITEPITTSPVPVEPGALVPQMFMRYFTGQPGTNGNGVTIFAPVGFVPPVPVAVPPPSSSATFQTVPPGKP